MDAFEGDGIVPEVPVPNLVTNSKAAAGKGMTRIDHNDVAERSPIEEAADLVRQIVARVDLQLAEGRNRIDIGGNLQEVALTQKLGGEPLGYLCIHRLASHRGRAVSYHNAPRRAL